jgi:hypothetical protein
MGGYIMKEWIKAQKEVKEILVNAELNNEPFHWIVDQLGMVRLYEQGLPMHIVLGIIKEFTSDVEERERIKQMKGFDEEAVQKAYSTLEAEWNKRN